MTGRGAPPASDASSRAGFPRGIDALADSVRSLCATAVDELDIAVGLEAGGLSDAVAGELYAVADTQQLAAVLRARVPLRVADPPPQPAARATLRMRLRLSTRGLLYAAPGLYYLGIARYVRSPGTVCYLVGGMAAAWVLGQALAVLAHRLRARTGPHNTARVLRRAILGSLVVAAAGFAVTDIATPPEVATVLAAQLLYMAGATVLLQSDQDRTLMFLLVPGSTAALVGLVGGRPVLPAWVLPATVTLTALVVAGVAGWGPACRRAEHLPVRPRIDYPDRSDITAVVPYAAFGLVCAVAVGFQPVADMVVWGRRGAPATSGLAMLPLVLAMGWAELELRRLRTAGVSAVASRTLRLYRRAAAEYLLAALLRFGAVTTVAAGGMCVAAWMFGRLNRATVVQSAAYVTLGAALLAGLVSAAFGHVWSAVGTSAAAVAGIAAGYSWSPAARLDDPAWHVVACGILLGALGAAALMTLWNPTNVLV